MRFLWRLVVEVEAAVAAVAALPLQMHRNRLRRVLRFVRMAVGSNKTSRA